MKQLFKVLDNIEDDFKSDNEKFNSLIDLGTGYFNGNEEEKALGAYEKAIEEDPKNSGGWIAKAMTHLSMTKVAEINSVNIDDYIKRAVKNSGTQNITKYTDAITMYYAYQYASAIKFYIDETNKAIAEKKKAQVAAVVGLATAAAGGAIANKSKGVTGAFIGYSMLAGGAGTTLKKGYDSFRLENLSKSLYGNAFAQAVVSVPTIKTCYDMLENADVETSQNINTILESWKESVVYLFKNEKANFLNLINSLNETDNLINEGTRNQVETKMDEILYFMDMIGLDNSEDFKKVLEIKKTLHSFSGDYSEEELVQISKKREGNRNKVGWIGAGLGLVIYYFAQNFLSSESPIPGLLLIAGGFLLYRWYKKQQNQVNTETGLSKVHDKISTINKGFNSIVIEKNEIELNYLGL